MLVKRDILVKLNKMPIIMISPTSATHVVRAGAADYIFKPAKPEKIVDSVVDAIGSYS